MPDHTPLLAVLIDADNTSPKWTRAIFEEIAAIGEASVRRCYGDFSSQLMSGWNKVQAEFGLVPHHRPANTVGKNLTEARDLLLKAMDGIDQDSDWYALGRLGQQVTAANPDFDTRSYGKKKLSDLVHELKVFETKSGPGNQLLVRRVD